MSDLVDIASGLEAEHLALSLSRIPRDIPAGHAGECDECGAVMPRLVDGRCGFCRDGRRPPAERYPDTATIAEPAHQQKETDVSTIDNRKITVEGAALAAVDRLALKSDIPFKQVAAELIVAASQANYESIVNVPNSLLADELIRRMGDGVSDEEYATVVAERDAAVVRAQAAEGQIATLKTQILLILQGVHG